MSKTPRSRAISDQGCLIISNLYSVTIVAALQETRPFDRYARIEKKSPKSVAYR